MLPDRPLSKREIGLLCVAIGVISFLVVIGVDIVDAGREGGIGPAQRLAMAGTATLTIIGLTLIPLGDDTA